MDVLRATLDHIDKECRLFDRCEAGREVDRCRRLSDPAFLICDRDNSRQESLDGRKLSKASEVMQDVSRETWIYLEVRGN